MPVSRCIEASAYFEDFFFFGAAFFFLATVPVFFPSDTDSPFGWQDPRAWALYEKWMRANNLLKPLVQGERPPLTNEFLPGEGLEQGTSGLG